MLKDNNFYIGDGDTPQFVRTIDRMLRNSENYIRYEDVLKERKISKVSAASSNKIAYKTYLSKKNKLTRALTNIKDYLWEEHQLTLDFANKIDAKDGFRYPQKNRDPLVLLREHQSSLCRKQLMDFIQSSADFLPLEWFEYFMQGTPLLMEYGKTHLSGNEIIQSDSSRLLRNRDLLPVLYNAIVNRQPLSIMYWAMYKEDQKMIFHPHFLKEYNGRWFAFGFASYSDGTERHECCLALDRIKKPISNADPDTTFVDKRIPSYSHFFDDIVGVTHLANEPLCSVSIKTLDQYTHFRLMTKPIHLSQKEIMPFDEELGFGIWQIDVRKNRELEGLLLSFGNHIEVSIQNYNSEEGRQKNP